MQPTPRRTMSSLSSSLPHSIPHTRAPWPPSSSHSHHHHQRPNCNPSHSQPGQSSSPETTMVDFDVLLHTSAPAPHTLYPYRPLLSEHGASAVDSLGSFNSVLHKASLASYVRTTQRQLQGHPREQVQLVGIQSQGYQIPPSRGHQDVLQDRTSAQRVSGAKPPTQPKEGATGASDQVPKTRAAIRRARAARNRSSARRSRLKKKEENQRDMEKATTVEKQNETLRQRVIELREKMLNLQKIANALGLVDTQQGDSSSDAGSLIEPLETQR